MSKWKECKLGDVLKFGNGKTRPRTIGENPIYGGNGILGYTDKINYEGETIIIGRVGAYCGSVYYENRPIWISDNALASKPKGDNNAKFLYYFLKNLNLNQFALGSSHPLMTQTLLNSIDIEIFGDPEEQKAIVVVLSRLDDKIDLLHRQNKTLEALAETLFRQWFIEPFDKAQGGKAQDGWEEKKISDIAKHIKVNIKPSSKPNTIFFHYSIPAFDDGKMPKQELGRQILSNKYELFPNTIMVSKLNPRFPRIWAVGESVEENSICSTEFQVFKPIKKSYFSFLYYLFKSDDVINELQMAASGTSGSHQRVKPDDMLKIRFSIPTNERVEEFSKITMPLFHKKEKNRNQIVTLEKLRDTLLLKLMSGEVRVRL